MAELSSAPLYSVPWLFLEDLFSLAIVAGLLIWAVIAHRRALRSRKVDRLYRGFLVLCQIVLIGAGGVGLASLVIGRPQLDMHEGGMCYYARSGQNHALAWRDIARLEKYRSPRRGFDTLLGTQNKRRADNYGHPTAIAGFRLSLWSCRGEECISFIDTRYSAEDEAMALSLWRKRDPHRKRRCNAPASRPAGGCPG